MNLTPARKVALVVLLSVSIFIVLQSCKVVEPTSPATVGFQPDDLPVPDGLVQDRSESVGFEYTILKPCVLTYKGGRGVEYVVKFYKESMPTYNWQLVSESKGNPTMLTFVNNAEKSVISVHKKSSTYTVVKISRGLK
ncbi:MAG: hypothetical protein A2W23_05100 [Planctomycetes bacterium RBG_16_43_13]|nr:MAG: hypothetical protein A2W23_05100 [Planctomycetes bacterium RBG_16_43_13]